MAYRLKFSGRVVREISEAFDWYEEQSKGLGSEFELAFELQLKRLVQVPLLYAEIIPGVPAHSCHGFRMVSFTRSRMIWFTSWQSFTMCAILGAGRTNVPVNWSFHRALCVDEFQRRSPLLMLKLLRSLLSTQSCDAEAPAPSADVTPPAEIEAPGAKSGFAFPSWHSVATNRNPDGARLVPFIH